MYTYLKISWYKVDGNFVDDHRYDIDTTITSDINQWQVIEFDVVAPLTAVWARPIICIEVNESSWDGNGNGIIYVDDASFDTVEIIAEFGDTLVPMTIIMFFAVNIVIVMKKRFKSISTHSK